MAYYNSVCLAAELSIGHAEATRVVQGIIGEWLLGECPQDHWICINVSLCSPVAERLNRWSTQPEYDMGCSSAFDQFSFN